MTRPPLVFRPSIEPPTPADPSPAGPQGAAPALARPTSEGGSSGEGAGRAAVSPSSADGLDLFASEAFSQAPLTPEPFAPDPLPGGGTASLPDTEIRYKTHAPVVTAGPNAGVMAIAVLAILGIAGLLWVALGRSPARAGGGTAGATPPTGQAQFDSRPSGAEVVIDGVVRGKTPLKLSLPVGSHTLEIRGDAGTRTLPLAIEAGVLVSQYVELLATPDVGTGRLEVTSDPPGAQVTLDGVAKGTTPLLLESVDARDHTVTLTRGASTIYRTVRVTPGSTASVVASMGTPAPGAIGGYLALQMPFEVRVLEGGRLLGTSGSERLMLPAGRHQLELVSTALQFRATLSVNVEPGRVTSPSIAIPEGTLSVNALPWADVSIDGRSVGTTPLANLRVPIGVHEVVWRHPQLGERRQSVSVTVETPVRVGVNFTQ